MPKDFLYDPDSEAMNRGDYRPSEYLIDKTELKFDLDDTQTNVKSKLHIKKNPDNDTGGPLILDGEDMKLISVKVNGKELDRADFTVTDKNLIIKRPPEDAFTLEIENEINPEENSSLMGLYKSGGLLCTQCESQGFRRITYHLDRPDVLSTFKVTVEGDKTKYPTLLSNGNGDPKQSTDLGNGRHSITWEDPWPKPAYLFALVGGNLEVLEDTFTTRSGKDVNLRIFVEKGYEKEVEFAMESIKKAMKWDEDAYDREYDLDDFHIVAVNDFNFGAMENKGLNIFNISALAGSPETSTDERLTYIERVVGHEYFHNYSGDRVTLRDWFELTLKEGFTVLRDRQFTADMHSQKIKDIDDATALRTTQFAEDAGPNSHAIRPDRVAAFGNIYSRTIYDKGSHVLGMMKTMMGDEKWREATNEYFDRFDGQAVTCDDFVDVMEEVSGIDLTQFRRWYSQSGTPEIEYEGAYDADKKTYTLTLRQNTPGTADQPESEKQNLHIPVKVGLIGQSGKDVGLTLKGENANDEDTEAGQTTRVLHLRDTEQKFVFTGVDGPVTPSVLRGFSAPVKVTTQPSDDELVFRMAHDSDGFNKSEAAQRYATKTILKLVEDQQAGKALKLDQKFIDAYGDNLFSAANDGDQAFAAKMLGLPSYALLTQEMKTVDPDAVMAVIGFVRQTLLDTYGDDFKNLYDGSKAPKGEQYKLNPEQVGRRKLHNLTLSYLSAKKSPEALKRAKTQYDTATNMTERLSALRTVAASKGPESVAALKDFYDRYKDNANVVNTWLGVQAGIGGADALDRVKKLMEHEAFNIKTPNNVRALIGGFAAGNPQQFHRKDGEGYKFMADMVIQLNSINPKVAAGLAGSLANWRKYDADRQALMKGELERIRKTPDLAAAVREVVSNALKPRPGEEQKPAQDNKAAPQQPQKKAG